MPSQKPRISTYTDEKTVRKFKIIAAYNNCSMSDYVKQLINDAIKEHETQHGEIQLFPEGGVRRSRRANEKMNIIYISIIAIILLIIDILLTLSNKKQLSKKKENQSETEYKPWITYPYSKKMLLTKTEYNFYKILKEQCDKQNFLICPKVRMEDFLKVTDSKNHLKYRGYVKSRHIDFLICDNKLYILAGLELDDPTHNTEKAKKTDDFKDKVFKAIELPLYRIRVAEDYNIQINQMLENLKSITNKK